MFAPDPQSAISLRVQLDVSGDTTWRLLHRVSAGIVAADRLFRIDRLVQHVTTGWRPVAHKIDSEIPRRTSHLAHFANDDAVRSSDHLGIFGPLAWPVRDRRPLPTRLSSATTYHGLPGRHARTRRHAGLRGRSLWHQVARCRHAHPALAFRPAASMPATAQASSLSYPSGEGRLAE